MPWRVDVLSSQSHSAHELAGGRRLHDLCHTAATEWLRHGIDVVTVKAWLGHSSLTTTQRYVHYLGTEADIAALAKLERATENRENGTLV
jgi:site-specific recombinase XerD